MMDVLHKIITITSGVKRRLFYIMAATMFVSAIFDTMGVASVLPLISLVMNPDIVNNNVHLHQIYTRLGFAGINHFIIFAAFGILFIMLASNGLAAANTWIKLKIVWSINHYLSFKLLEKYLSQPYVYHLHSQSADVHKNIMQESNQLTNSFIMPVFNLCSKVMVIFLILILLFLVNPVVTILAIVVLGGAYAFIFLYTRQEMKLKGQERLRPNRERIKVVIDSIGGIKDIKVQGREPYFLQRFSFYSQKYSDLLAWNSLIGSIPRYALESMVFGGVILLIIYLFVRDQNPGGIIPIVGFYVFAAYRLMPALQEVFLAATSIKFNQPVLDKIYQELTDTSYTESDELADRGAIIKLPFEKRLLVENISYTYPKSSKTVIENVSLEIGRGTSIGLVLILLVVFLVQLSFSMTVVNQEYSLFKSLPLSTIGSISTSIILLGIITLVFLIMRLVDLIEKEGQYNLQTVYIDTLDELYTAIRSERHDIINHLQTIYGFNKLGYVEEVQYYLDELLGGHVLSNEFVITGTPGLTALIYIKSGIARTNDIKFEIEVDQPISNLTISPYEINNILGNLINNAFDAVMSLQSSQRTVKLYIGADDHNYIFKVSNYSQIDLNNIQNLIKKGFSTKKGNHSGLGLHICQQLINKYNGHMEVTSSNNIIEFTVYLPKVPVKEGLSESVGSQFGTFPG